MTWYILLLMVAIRIEMEESDGLAQAAVQYYYSKLSLLKHHFNEL